MERDPLGVRRDAWSVNVICQELGPNFKARKNGINTIYSGPDMITDAITITRPARGPAEYLGLGVAGGRGSALAHFFVGSL